MHAQPKYHVPTTLPANQSSQEFTITVPMNVPPGTYSFFVSGVGTVSYARDPVKLKAQEDRLAAVEKIVAENAVSLKSAQEAQAAAAKALADAQAAQKDAKSLTDAKTAADQAVVGGWPPFIPPPGPPVSAINPSVSPSSHDNFRCDFSCDGVSRNAREFSRIRLR